MQTNTPTATPPLLARMGRFVFGARLFIGLAAVLLSIEWLRPVPFLHAPHLALQWLALALIAGGLGLRAWGSGSAGCHTRAARIEAPRLITGGPFAYVRNPIYIGTMVLSLGMVVLIGDPRAFLCAAIALGILYAVIVPAEEAFLRTQFGDEYRRYCEAVPRLIPRLRPWPGRCEQPFQWRAARGEFAILLWLVLIYAGMQFEEYLDRIGLS